MWSLSVAPALSPCDEGGVLLSWFAGRVRGRGGRGRGCPPKKLGAGHFRGGGTGTTRNMRTAQPARMRSELKEGLAVASIDTNRQLPRGAPATFEAAAAHLLPPTAGPSVYLCN